MIFVVVLPKNALADGEDFLNQQDWIIRNQQNILEEERRQKEFGAIKREQEKFEKGKNLVSDDLVVSDKIAKCFPIKEVHFDGASLISDRQKAKMVKPFIGQCFAGEILSNLLKNLNSHYHNLGYVTTQIVIPKQNVIEGILRFQVIEGRIENLTFGDGKFGAKMQKFGAFGMIDGEILNIKDIHQGIYQINRLSSNAAVMKILPGSKDGESKIEIENNKKKPVSLKLNHDNLGSEFTGIRRSAISADFENFLSLNDSVSIDYTTNLNNQNNYKNSDTFSFGISLPFTYSTFSFDYYISEYLGTVISGNSTNKNSGFSTQKKFGFNRAIFSDGRARLNFDTTLSLKETASYVNQKKQYGSERRLVIGEYSLVFSTAFENGASLYIKPSYSRGLKILNATQDLADLSANEARAQFEVGKLYTSLSKQFSTKIPFSIGSEFNGQIAKSSLYGSEQFSVGGYYSVRGFRENYITGDSGYNLKNKIGVNLGDLSRLKQLSPLSLEFFYDYGFVQNRDAYDDSGRLSGAGFKGIFATKYFNASLTYGRALKKSQLITSPKKESEMVYFELSSGI